MPRVNLNVIPASHIWIYDPTAWQYELWVFTVKWTTLSIWPRQDPIICCRNPTCQDEIFSYKYSIIPARWGVFHLYKHAILFYNINTPPYNQVYQQGWIKISNPLPFRYHIIRHICKLYSFKLFRFIPFMILWAALTFKT
jgi:hypothetical protein